MECQKCHQRSANVQITQFINGQKHEFFLCDECAQGAHISVDLPQLPLSQIKNLLGFLGQNYASEQQNADLVCSNCMTPYRKIYDNGHVGCSECYKQFRNQIEGVLQRIQGVSSHRGKIPQRLGDSYQVKRDLEELKLQLFEAVKHEEYEKAAELRDKIKILEEKQSGKPGEQP